MSTAAANTFDARAVASGWQSPPLRIGRFDERHLVRMRGPALGLLMFAVLFVSAASVTWVDATSTAAGFWPPSGVGFVALLVLPVRRWGWVLVPIVAIGLFGVAAGSYTLGTALIWAAGNVAEPVIGASLMRGHRRRAVLPLSSLLGRFILYAAVLGPAVGGAIGSIGSARAYGTSWVRQWVEWTVGDGLGVLIVTPLLLAGAAKVSRSRVELLALAAVVATVAALAFSGVGPGNGATVPYLIFVTLVVCAMRFGMRIGSAVAFVIAEAVNVAAAMGRGPFAVGAGGADTALSLQVFLAISVATSFIIGALVSDLAGRDEVQLLLTDQAKRDALTGLPNRVRFAERLLEELPRTQATGTRLGVVLIDLDHFKSINDRYGHPAGDEVLVVVADLFDRRRRPDDLLARLGGDEFALLCSGDEATLRETADVMLSALAGTHRIGTRWISLAASAGVAMATDGDVSGVDLMRRADIALYRSKRPGCGPVTLFDEDLEAETHRRAELEDELRGAIDRDELSVVYQPIVDVQSGAIAHLEALVRWDSRVAGPVGPDEFIPIAEEVGLIGPIGEWVLRTACTQVSHWNAQRDRTAGLAVNVSARQLGDCEFVAVVAAVLAETGLPPQALTIEITETAMMDDLETSGRVLGELSDLGVRLSMDDFGTGYSSMTYLRRFPLDSLKIDRSFLAGLTESLEDQTIVESVIHLGANFGLDVIAEGVETPAQHARLHQLGCRYAQGYLWYKPLAPEAVEQLADSAFGGSDATPRHLVRQ